ncbi:hypothetical protein ACJX0J_036968, partial [Zea mays]
MHALSTAQNPLILILMKLGVKESNFLHIYIKGNESERFTAEVVHLAFLKTLRGEGRWLYKYCLLPRAMGHRKTVFNKCGFKKTIEFAIYGDEENQTLYFDKLNVKART